MEEQPGYRANKRLWWNQHPGCLFGKKAFLVQMLQVLVWPRVYQQYTVWWPALASSTTSAAWLISLLLQQCVDVQPENTNSKVLKTLTKTTVFSSLILCYIIELFKMLKVLREIFFDYHINAVTWWLMKVKYLINKVFFCAKLNYQGLQVSQAT